MLIGVQFNQNVYASITTGIPPEPSVAPGFEDLERKVVLLAPQLVRLFFNDQQDAGANSTRDSFVDSVKLAQQAGATINVTLQSVAPYLAAPDAGMAKFAALLNELVTTHGVSNLRWVTLQNEPNSTRVTPPVLNQMYRLLDKLLIGNGLRQQIRFMGGDLLQEGPDQSGDLPSLPPVALSESSFEEYWKNHRNEEFWFTYMAEYMNDILDAYSIHVYWDVVSDVRPHAVKFLTRLEDVLGADGILSKMPEAGRKPVFVMEFGVRGNGKPEPGVFTNPHGPPEPIGQTRIAAFQHAWFQIAAAQYGCAGTAKWDCYYGMYDKGLQAYYAIGKPGADGWPLYPMYFLLWLFTNATEAGWHATDVKPSSPSAGTDPQLAGFKGPDPELTIFGLDRRGATLNEPSPTLASYRIPTGAPGTKFNLIVWNKNGDGSLFREPDVTADEKGIATITMPLNEVFALTTKALTLPVESIPPVMPE